MAARSRKLVANVESSRRLSRRRLAAVVAQIGSYATTFAFVAVFVDPMPALLVAGLIEWVLFELKRDYMLLGVRGGALGLAAVVADSVLNGGGLWAFVLKLDSTDAYKMFAQSLKLGTDMRLIPALVIALVLGYVLAIAPHKLWNGQLEAEDE